MTEGKWHLYIVECQNGAYYTGITLDLERRLKEHQTGKRAAKFFRCSPFKKLIYTEGSLSRSQALQLEISIKKLSKNEKRAWIERQINDCMPSTEAESV